MAALKKNISLKPSTDVELYLFLHFVALGVLLHQHMGSTTTASEFLAHCHTLLEQEGFTMSGEINLCEQRVRLQWLSKAEYFSLVYLLSGLCMSSESNLAPAKKYLVEGAKFLEGKFIGTRYGCCSR